MPRPRHSLLALSVAACFALQAPGALANPTGPTVISGNAAFAASGSALTVTNSANAIIHWQGFSIGAQEITRFLQPSAASGDQWTSSRTKGRYPLRWSFRVPSLGIEGVTTTPLRDQELTGALGASPSYWEGSIDIEGTRYGRPLRGTGYLEMTGYAGAVKLD